ncbi:hypothetical protein N7540_007063 [Penicillium herquei]|nr:hypothetical protein N7540_007063 [Penicillium herquei]
MESELRNKAYTLINGFEELQVFLSKITDGQSPLESSDKSLGCFQLVADAWNEIPRDPIKIEEIRGESAESAVHSDCKTKTKDEEEALTMNIPEVRVKWNSFTSPFDKLTFDTTARVDGFLGARDPQIPEIFAIAEVKSIIRDPNDHPEVFWQEAAEIVTLICHDQKPENSLRKRPRERYQHGFVITDFHSMNMF